MEIGATNGAMSAWITRVLILYMGMAAKLRRLAVLSLTCLAAVGGAAIMAVELLGARMLSVGYGGSLYVWAAMISVALFSLAIGYFVGGALADRFPNPALLLAILTVAGSLTAVCPHTRPILRACYRAFGLKWGALASSALVFVLPLGLLGMVSPFVVRLLGGSERHFGTTAGGVFAISTLGSVAGTLAAGLWLIPRFGTAMGFKIVSLATVVPAVVGIVARYRYRGSVALLVPMAVAIVMTPAAGVGTRYIAPDGEDAIIEAVCDSAHGRITVMTKGQYRLLLVNGIVQTAIPLSLSHMEKGYCLRNHYFQGLIPYITEAPSSANALIIGLAGGLTASVLRNHGMQVDCVDLDPEIIELAREWFSFSGHAVAADGRRHLEDCAEDYDFCVIDTYSGDAFPFHMASEEALKAAQGVLKPKGVLVINFIGSPSGDAFASICRTVKEVFPNIRALRSEPGNDVQPLTVFASAIPIVFSRGWQPGPGDRTDLDSIDETIEQMTVVPDAKRGRVLVDAHNPIDMLVSEEALRWRQRIIDHIGEAAVF